MTYLTVPILVKSISQAKADIAQALSAHAEMLELRLDYLPNPTVEDVDEVVSAARKSSLLIIATCRPQNEGGRFKGPEEQRQLLLNHALKAGADYVDIELASLAYKPPDLTNKQSIISHHDFDKLPSNINDILKDIKKTKPAVAKIAYQPQRITECFPALDIIKENKNVISLAMGDLGIMTRLLAKKLGAFLTFASLSPGSESAPSQITIKDMKQLYRWDALDSKTKLYGVIGYPIAHSLSPTLHNAAFSEIGYNGLYLPFLVEPTWEEFKNFMDGILERKWLHLRGLSITIPHKVHALEYVLARHGGIGKLAQRIGSVNTLIFEENGRLSGFNTDYTGAMDAIMHSLDIKRTELSSLSTAVLGAGGVARALVAGLTDEGAEVTIYNRTAEKAQLLAQEFGCKWRALSDLKKLKHLDARVVINCTSIGMHPKVDETPLTASLLRDDMVVFDTVYNPLQTKLLLQAQATGAKTIDGMSMFINQAAAQFELFTGKPAPRSTLRRAVLG